MEKTQNTELLKQLFKSKRDVSSKITNLSKELNYYYGFVTLKMQNKFKNKASLDDGFIYHLEKSFKSKQSPYELRKVQINKILEKKHWQLRQSHEEYKLTTEDESLIEKHLDELYQEFDLEKENYIEELKDYDKDNTENELNFIKSLQKRILSDKKQLLSLTKKLSKYENLLNNRQIRIFREDVIEELINSHLEIVNISNYKQLQLSRNQFIITNYHVLVYAKQFRKINKIEEKLIEYNQELKEVDNKLNDLIKNADDLGDNQFIQMQEEQDIHLRISGLKMYFGGLKAVDDLTFDIKRGEVFSLIGPNGAGKTTVFNCITQFYKPTAGEVYINNNLGVTKRLNDYKVHDVVNQGIARTFQNVELINELTVFENLLVGSHSNFTTTFTQHLFRTIKSRTEEKILHIKAYNILRRLNLLEHMFAYPQGLPYGILKRVEFARALMTDPEIIILDEPAAGLNETETNELSKLIRELNKELNLTIFLVEHDMSLVMDISDRICAISFGKMLAIGTPQEIQKNPLVQEAYLGGSRDE